MPQVELVTAQHAYERVKNGTALLVCAYDSDQKFERLQLEGAISLRELEATAAAVPRDKELIFY